MIWSCTPTNPVVTCGWLHRLRQQGHHREGVPNRSLGRLRGTEVDRFGRLGGRVRGHRRPRRPGAGQGVPRGPGRLQRNPAGVDRRPATARPSRNSCERVRREFWGYVPDEALDNDALIAERYRGIRPARLPRLPRPHREADAVEPAGRRAPHRHPAHRVDGHVARRRRLRLVLLAPRQPLLRPSDASPATRWRATPNARAGVSPRQNAGCRRTSGTTPKVK